MLVQKVDGSADVSLTVEDCALLSRACTIARTSGGPERIGGELQVVALEGLESILQVLAVSCAESLNRIGPPAAEWLQMLNDLNMPNLVS